MSVGIIFALLASSLVVAKDVVSKKISENVNPFVSSFSSFLFATPFYLLFLFILWLCGLEDFSWQGSFWFYVLLRSLADTGAESCRMLALKRGELSTVAAIMSLHSLITLVISPVITGDPITFNIILGVIFATLGTALFYKVPKKIDLKTFLISMLAALFFSLNNCFDRLSAINASATFSGFAMNIGAGLMTIPFVLMSAGLNRSKIEITNNFSAFTLRGFFEAVFMAAKLLAMASYQAPVVSAVLRLSLLFQVFAGKAFFEEKGFVYRTLGSIFIILGAVISLL